jgi:putative pyruvate formate lyase activating enzyme
VNRLAGEVGYCGLDAEVTVFRELLHPLEEETLNPSHQVYFSGCNLRCEFCSVLEWIMHPRTGPFLDPATVLESVALRRKQGAVTLNLLGGEPAVSLHGVLQLLAQVPAPTRVVWNSNMYYQAEVATYLEGLVDVTLADLKCGCPGCAERMLDASDYVSVVRRNIRQAALTGEVIVRCPVLPGHERCCLQPNLEWIAAECPRVGVSLRADYIPPVRPRHAPGRYVTPDERRSAESLLHSLGLRRVA